MRRYVASSSLPGVATTKSASSDESIQIKVERPASDGGTPSGHRPRSTCGTGAFRSLRQFRRTELRRPYHSSGRYAASDNNSTHAAGRFRSADYSAKLPQDELPAAWVEAPLYEAFLHTIVTAACGVAAAELWLIRSRHGKRRLVRPRGGYAVSHALRDEPELQPMLQTLAVQPPEEASGSGVAGGLWDATLPSLPIRWIRLEQLTHDEVHIGAHGAAAAAAFGSAAAVLLPRSGAEGLLVLYARAGASPAALNAEANVAFLKATAHTASMLVAQAGPCRVLRVQRVAIDRAWVKLRIVARSGLIRPTGADRSKTRAVSDAKGAESPEKPEEGPERPSMAAGAQRRCARIGAYLHKYRGVEDAKPPPLSWSKHAWQQSCWVWIGASLALLLVSGVDTKIQDASNGDYLLLLGSYGALCTLLFGAPNSPFSQPRNVFGGSLVAATVAVVFFYFSGDRYLSVLPVWAAAGLAPAAAIGLMHKLNLTHPPAGAHCLIFVTAGPGTTDLGWLYLLIPVTLGNVLCVCVAIAWNNLSKHRQYPVFW